MTRNMTVGYAVLSCQPFFETCSRNISNFVPQKPILRDFKTYLAIEMSLKKSINTAWQITEVSNSAKQKVKLYTENRTANIRISRTLFTDLYTQSRTFRFVLASLSIPNLPLLGLWFRSTVQLGISLWPRELDKPPWSCRRCWLLHSSKTLLVERVQRLNSFKKLVGRTGKSSSIDHIFMQSFCSLQRHLTWENLSACSSQIWTPRHLLKGLTTTILHISSASLTLRCWQNLPKFWPIRGHTRSWYTRTTFC